MLGSKPASLRQTFLFLVSSEGEDPVQSASLCAAALTLFTDESRQQDNRSALTSRSRGVTLLLY